jgi:bifunctional UDP-N-acetylglucosamine pyrophosphorylase / glucosamine-1-phosphate N-acetyltransferase
MTSDSKKTVRAVVLAAGQGKRMKTQRAKVLHEVLGKTILTRILTALDQLGLEKIHIIVGHEAQQIIDYLQVNPPGTPYSTHIQQPQLGTGHALQQAVPDLSGFSGTLLVTVGDAPLLSEGTLRSLVANHQETGATVSLLTALLDDPKNYGRIVRGAKGEVLKIVEDKDCTIEEKAIREINPAIYCFEWPKVLSGLQSLKNDNKQKEYYLTDLVGWAQENKLPIAGTVTPDWREVAAVNSRSELAEVTALLRDRTIEQLMSESGVTITDTKGTWIAPEVRIGADSIVLPGCYLVGEITIGAGCSIGPNTVMTGKVSIGDRTSVVQSQVVNSTVGADCRVGPFAHMRDQAVVADKCRIGNYVEIKKSRIGASTNVSHLSYVGDASLGSKVNIGAGTITANYDHLTGTKSNTIVEDGASTGSNSVLVAPITIGKEASVAAGSVATRDVPAGALAVARTRQENKEGWTDRRRKAKVTAGVSAKAPKDQC